MGRSLTGEEGLLGEVKEERKEYAKQRIGEEVKEEENDCEKKREIMRKS